MGNPHRKRQKCQVDVKIWPLLWTAQGSCDILLWFLQRRDMGQHRSEILQGTLDLMVLKALDAMGPLHGYGIARRLEQLSEDVLKLNEGTVYAALLRLGQQG